jgi:GNAT superfamily N-acetyltransferase
VTQIRLANPQDQPQIIALVQTVYQEFNFGWDPEGYHKDLYSIAHHFQPPNAFWVAEEINQIVGCIGLEVFPTLPGEPNQLTTYEDQIRIATADCELVRLYVSSNQRGKKIGLKLCQTCIAYAQSQNCQAMEIWSDKVLHQAHKLYQSLGAKIVGERLCPPPDEDPEWGMILPLC